MMSYRYSCIHFLPNNSPPDISTQSLVPECWPSEVTFQNVIQHSELLVNRGKNRVNQCVEGMASDLCKKNHTCRDHETLRRTREKSHESISLIGKIRNDLYYCSSIYLSLYTQSIKDIYQRTLEKTMNSRKYSEWNVCTILMPNLIFVGAINHLLPIVVFVLL